MRRTLLFCATVAMASMCMNAEKVVFIAPGSQKIYKGNADMEIVIPEGFYFNKPQAGSPDETIKKALACDVVMIEELQGGNYGFANDAAVAPYSYINNGALWWYKYNALKFTPAAGITLKNITFRMQRFGTGKTAVPSDFVWPVTINKDDTKITYDGTVLDKAQEIYMQVEMNTNQPMVLQSYGQNRVLYFEIEYEGTLAQPLQPLCSGLIPFVYADEEISFDSTPGAEIHYTLDGEAPTASSPKYEAPFKLTKDAIVRAIAVKDGVSSFPSYDEFFVVDADAKMAMFDFSDVSSLVTSDDKLISLENFEEIATTSLPDYKYWLKGTELADNKVLLSFICPTEAATPFIARPWSWHYVTTYKNTNALTKVTAPEGTILTNIISVGTNITNMGLSDNQPGEWAFSETNKDFGMWKCDPAKPTNTITFKGGADVGQIYAFYKSNSTGVSDINAEETDAEADFYNLQGVKVANPSNGIYIRRQGGVSKKVLVKE